MGKIADLSHHQGTIDFSKASKELDLAIIRVQYGSGTIDREYKKYVAGCKQYGIPFGHYAYARFITVADAKVEAVDFIARADKDAKFLVVDVEEMTTKDPADIVPATQAFIDVCKKAGFMVGLYTGHHFYGPHRMDRVKADFLWIPRYASNDCGEPTGPKPAFDCDMWQFTQCGKLAGVKGNVDLNQLMGDKKLSFYIGEEVSNPHLVTKDKETIVNKTAKRKKKSNGTYVVVSGDTLGAIASDLGVSVSQLQNTNGIKNANKISAGQVIKFPGASKLSSVSAKKYHKVTSGNTVSELAVKYGSSLSQIKSWNKLDGKYTIFVGQKLRVK